MGRIRAGIIGLLGKAPDDQDAGRSIEQWQDDDRGEDDHDKRPQQDGALTRDLIFHRTRESMHEYITGYATTLTLG
jgi:hypothetical protein